MPSAPRHARMGPALFAAGGLAFLSFAVWAAAVAAAWVARCPGGAYEPTGIAKGASVWPPGSQCPGARGHLYVHEAVPGLKWIAAIAAIAAIAVFAVGLLAAIADLRARRSRERVVVPSLALWAAATLDLRGSEGADRLDPDDGDEFVSVPAFAHQTVELGEVPDDHRDFGFAA